MKSTKLRSFKQLRIELRRLKRVHDVTVYAYQQTRDYIEQRLKNKEIFGNTVISMASVDGERILARSPHEIIPRLSDTYPEVMRESLFVRAVSQFEVFIVDTVWEISKRSIEPFKQQDKILEYPQAKLLSYSDVEEIKAEIISAECRQLTSQGFNYARKYYEKRFGIRFSDCPTPITAIEEIHERRHIFVHRGGYIDDQYQKRFAPDMQVDERLAITDEYFRATLDSLMALGELVAQCVDTTWPITPHKAVKRVSLTPTPSKPDAILLVNSELAGVWEKRIAESQTAGIQGENLAYWFKAKFKDREDMEDHLNASYYFRVDWEKRALLPEVFLASSVLSECEAEWIVDGPKDDAGPYVASQKVLAKRGRFVEFEARRLRIKRYAKV